MAKAYEHLGCGLPADAAVDIGLVAKIFIQLPQVGDGIAEEDHSLLTYGGRFEGGIRLAVAVEFAEIVAQRDPFGLAPLPQRLLCRGRLGWLLGKCRESKEYKEYGFGDFAKCSQMRLSRRQDSGHIFVQICGQKSLEVGQVRDLPPHKNALTSHRNSAHRHPQAEPR